MVTLVPVSASPPGPEVKCMYAIMHAGKLWLGVGVYVHVLPDGSEGSEGAQDELLLLVWSLDTKLHSLVEILSFP